MQIHSESLFFFYQIKLFIVASKSHKSTVSILSDLQGTTSYDQSTSIRFLPVLYFNF